MPSKQFKAIDLENFLDNHPLNFLLFYGDYEGTCSKCWVRSLFKERLQFEQKN